MPRVRNDDGSCPPTIGCVNQLPAISRIGNDTLDGGRLWADDRNHPIRGYDISETDIDQLNVHGG